MDGQRALPAFLQPRPLRPRTKAPSTDELIDATLHKTGTLEAVTATQSCSALRPEMPTRPRTQHTSGHHASGGCCPWSPHRHVELTHGPGPGQGSPPCRGWQGPRAPALRRSALTVKCSWDL